MVVDLAGSVVQVGDSRLLSGIVRRIEGSNLVVVLPDGQVVRVDGASTALAGKTVSLAQSVWSRLDNVFEPKRAFNGVATATTGTGVSWFVGRAMWLTQTQQAGFHSCFQANSSLNTSGVHAASICGVARGSWHLYDAARWFFRFDLNIANRFAAMRVGFWGNDPVTPVATTGRPSHGIWIEYDPATLANSNWWFCASDGSTVAVEDSGLAITTSLERAVLFDYVDSAMTRLWLLGDGVVPVDAGEIKTHIPSSWTARVGTPFVQVLSANTGTYGHFILKEGGPLRDTHPNFLLPE